MGMNNYRKGLRFYRNIKNIKSIKERKSVLKLKNKAKEISEICQLLVLLSDICDSIFYITDHIEVFHFLALQSTGNMLLQHVQLTGNIAWVLGALFLFISAFIQYKEIRGHSQEMNKRRICQIDMISNVLEFVLGWTFIYTWLMTKTQIVVLVVFSTVLKLSKLKYQ